MKVTVCELCNDPEAFIWDSVSEFRYAHTKYYLPNEEGYWEASWYERGDGDLELTKAEKAKETYPRYVKD